MQIQAHLILSQEVELECFLQPKLYLDCSDESIQYCWHIRDKKKCLELSAHISILIVT